jgi:uncharacterized membrane protein YhaH (DUF805 family)
MVGLPSYQNGDRVELGLSENCREARLWILLAQSKMDSEITRPPQAAHRAPNSGTIVLLVWFCMKGTTGPNRFGPDPLASS